ncbi:MAG: hypothetical protein M5U25_13845 [Planctomycetota bacterium]|nr:hypothetical protein [Planctomycetota bacterium]
MRQHLQHPATDAGGGVVRGQLVELRLGRALQADAHHAVHHGVVEGAGGDAKQAVAGARLDAVLQGERGRQRGVKVGVHGLLDGLKQTLKLGAFGQVIHGLLLS